MGHAGSLIRVEGVRRVYGSGAARVTALDGIDLDIRAGELVALAGPSGSGKTTLLNLIAGLDDPDAGRVSVDGVTLAGLGDRARARLRLARLGFVFQHFNLVPVLSAAENVELPLLFRDDLDAAARRQRVAQALERVRLTPAAGRRPAQLSGGERQRVAVARAVAGRPAVVLADEPTANLDHETGAAVIELLRELNREAGTTFVYATHDPALLGHAGRIVRLRDGRLEHGDGAMPS